MKAKTHRIFAAAAVIATLPWSAAAIEIDTNKWFAYYQQPPLGRGMVEVIILLSHNKCHVSKAVHWKDALVYYGTRQVRHCWNTSDNQRIIGICEPQVKDGELRLLRNGCFDADMAAFKKTSSLPAAAFPRP